MTVTSKEIAISQAKSAEALETVGISKQRKLQSDSPSLPAEKSEFRSIVGSLSRLAQQTRLDLAVAVSSLLSAQRWQQCETLSRQTTL